MLLLLLCGIWWCTYIHITSLFSRLIALYFSVKLCVSVVFLFFLFSLSLFVWSVCARCDGDLFCLSVSLSYYTEYCCMYNSIIDSVVCPHHTHHHHETRSSCTHQHSTPPDSPRTPYPISSHSIVSHPTTISFFMHNRGKDTTYERHQQSRGTEETQPNSDCEAQRGTPGQQVGTGNRIRTYTPMCPRYSSYYTAAVPIHTEYVLHPTAVYVLHCCIIPHRVSIYDCDRCIYVCC